MSEPSLNIPLEWFMLSNDHALQNFMVKRLEMAANLEKEIRSMQAALLNLRESAGVAQFVLEHRADILRMAGDHLANAKVSSISDAA